MTDRCKQKVFPAGMNFPRATQCSRAAKKDGYCLQHHPDAEAERRRKSDERSKAQQERSPYRIIARLQASNNELADALEAVIAISDRKHDAWDAAKAALAKARGESQ